MVAFPHITFAAKSDVGRKRKNNEDAFGTFPSLGVYCVADGMGGGDDGEVASAATVGAVEKFVKAHPPPANAAYTAESVVAGVRSAVNGASKWIFDRAKTSNLKGCGSTFVGVCLDPARPGEAIALHAGDSRLYRIRGRGIQQITKDHSAAELIGARNENDINPMFRGMILRAVGIQPSVEIDATPLPLKEGDCILICSDGLCRMVQDKKIVSIVRDNDAPDAAVEALIAAANEAGGIDNVTAVLVKVGKFPPPLPTIDMPPKRDTSDAPTTSGGEDSLPTRDNETNPSFDLATDEADGDAASFATVTQTSATLTGATDDQSADSTPRATLTGTGWKAMQEVSVDEPPKKGFDPRKAAAIAVVAVAAVAAIAFFASSGESGSGNNLGEGQREQSTVSDSKFAEEEIRKNAEAEMAAKMAEMERQLKEAKEKAEREKAEREAEAKRLEAERKAAEEARQKAEEEMTRIAAERKAAEELRKAQEEARKAQEEALKEAQRKLKEAEESRIAAEREAAEKAKKEAAEERKRQEEARRKAEAAKRKAEEAAKRKAEEAARRKAEEAEAKRLESERKAREEAERRAEIRERVRPMLEDARDYYVGENETLEYLRCLKAACDNGYELPKNEWQNRVKDRYNRRIQFLSFHMTNKIMAEKKNLDQNKLKAEFDELGELFSGLRYDNSSASGR